jgi:hypothetical protein
MTQQQTRKSTLITTFTGDIYIIYDKTPDEIMQAIEHVDMVTMPNGSRIHKKSFSSLQSYEDYTFQTEQKARHKKGQYLRNGEWNDNQGPLGIKAELERITGTLPSLESSKTKQLTTS